MDPQCREEETTMSDNPTFTFVAGAAQMADYEDGRVKPVTVLKATGANVVVFAFDTGSALPEHTALQPVLLQALEGRLSVRLDSADIILQPGDLLHIEPNTPHSVDAAEPA